MPYIIKTNPFDAEPDRTVTVIERPFYGGRNIRVGDDIFVWFSETAGGSGLAWQAHTVSVDAAEAGKVSVTMRLVSRFPAGVLGKEDLEPLRNIRDNSPQSELARKLYYQAHNKIAALTQEESDYLLGHSD